MPVHFAPYIYTGLNLRIWEEGPGTQKSSHQELNHTMAYAYDLDGGPRIPRPLPAHLHGFSRLTWNGQVLTVIPRLNRLAPAEWRTESDATTLFDASLARQVPLAHGHHHDPCIWPSDDPHHDFVLPSSRATGLVGEYVGKSQGGPRRGPHYLPGRILPAGVHYPTGAPPPAVRGGAAQSIRIPGETESGRPRAPQGRDQSGPILIPVSCNSCRAGNVYVIAGRCGNVTVQWASGHPRVLESGPTPPDPGGVKKYRSATNQSLRPAHQCRPDHWMQRELARRSVGGC